MLCRGDEFIGQMAVGDDNDADHKRGRPLRNSNPLSGHLSENEAVRLAPKAVERRVSSAFGPRQFHDKARPGHLAVAIRPVLGPDSSSVGLDDLFTD